MNPRDIMTLCTKSVFVLLTKKANEFHGTTINSLTPVLVEDGDFKIIIVMKTGFSEKLDSEFENDFSISLLSQKQADIAQRFASANRNLVKDDSILKYDEEINVKVVANAIFALRCKVFNSMDFGTNELVICEVVSFKQYHNGLLPLTYSNRKYH